MWILLDFIFRKSLSKKQDFPDGHKTCPVLGYLGSFSVVHATDLLLDYAVNEKAEFGTSMLMKS